jgi:hypothetical protein
LSFVHAAAAAIAAETRSVYVYYLGDRDPSGVDIDRCIERDLRRYAPDCDLTFERVAVLPEQIEQFGLQTRPTKTSDSRSRSFAGESVEVDAIAPPQLRGLCEACITRHIDDDQLKRTLAVEQAERETLAAIAGDVA